MITETEPVARALDDAADHWPLEGGNRAKLLMRLIEEGHQAVIGRQNGDTQRCREAVVRTSGALGGLYGAGYLDKLREDWPG